MDRTDTLGIYIHVPFCRGKCPYCDFYSVGTRELQGEYVSAVIDEITSFRRMSEFADEKAAGRAVDSVYFGGGTPSELEAEGLIRILHAASERFGLTADCEITAECNPSRDNLPDFFRKLRNSGFTRISLGMQSAVDEERKKLGRRAGSAQVREAVYAAKTAGFDNISLDVMLGIPSQTSDSLMYTLNFADSLGVQHISPYMLILEEGTFFYKNKDKLSLPDDDSVCDMYLTLCSFLEEKGYIHYEISNFCKEGFESRHNTRYWRAMEYLGFGPAAHSYYNGARFYSERDLQGFINGKKAVYDSPGGDMDEYIMLNLRLSRGLIYSELEEKYGYVPDEKFLSQAGIYCSQGLLGMFPGGITLTDKGRLLSNSVIAGLLG